MMNMNIFLAYCAIKRFEIKGACGASMTVIFEALCPSFSISLIGVY